MKLRSSKSFLLAGILLISSALLAADHPSLYLKKAPAPQSIAKADPAAQFFQVCWEGAPAGAVVYDDTAKLKADPHRTTETVPPTLLAKNVAASGCADQTVSVIGHSFVLIRMADPKTREMAAILMANQASKEIPPGLLKAGK